MSTRLPAVAGKAKAGMAHSDCGLNVWVCRYKTVRSFDNMTPYLSDSEVMTHEEALTYFYFYLYTLVTSGSNSVIGLTRDLATLPQSATRSL